MRRQIDRQSELINQLLTALNAGTGQAVAKRPAGLGLFRDGGVAVETERAHVPVGKESAGEGVTGVEDSEEPLGAGLRVDAAPKQASQGLSRGKSKEQDAVAAAAADVPELG